MKETDLQTLSNGIPGIIAEYQNSTTQAERGATLGNLQKLTSIIGNEEKRKNEDEIKKEQFLLNKDHVYFQDKLEDERFKHQVKESSERNDLEKMRLDLQAKDISDRNSLEQMRLKFEKERLDQQQAELIQKRIDSKNDMRFRLITFGITTIIGLAEVIIPLVIYRKLAYTNLNLIYKDEGRPSTDYRNSIKDVQNLIRKK